MPTTTIDGWTVTYAPGGMVRAHDGARTVYAELRFTEGRWNAYSMTVTASTSISVYTCRNLPLAKIERAADVHASTLRTPADPGACTNPADILATHFANTATTDRTIETASPIEATEEPAEPLRHPGRRITDEFLEELAVMYRWLVSDGNAAPAMSIAEQTGAPLGTARRWICDARKRRFLPPGRPGRVG